jgi:lipid-A-disaccharide synthase
LASLLFVAGDLSGDANMALLAQRVLAKHPSWRIFALGGPHLRASGAQMLGDSSGGSAIGFLPSLMIVPRALQQQARVLAFLKKHQIDAAVLCDWGAFNGRLLKPLKRRGVPVLYYFPPRSWQREGARGLSIVPHVTRVATPFSWSAQKLKAAGCDAEWVGHPLLEAAPPFDAKGEYSPSFAKKRDALRHEFGAAENEVLIALFPGSRNLELKLIAPTLAGAAVLLLKTRGASTRAAAGENEGGAGVKKLRFVVAAAAARGDATRKFFADAELQGVVKVVENRGDDALCACDAAVVKSGTSTLQAAVMGAPQVVVYDVPPLLRAQARRMGVETARVPFVAMPNILMGRPIVRELLGENCTAQNVAVEVEALLQPEKAAQMRCEYSRVREELGAALPFGATERTAQMLEEMLQNKSTTHRS